MSKEYNDTRVRGALVSIFKRYILKRFGEDGWERVLSNLSPKDKRILSFRISPGSWYPYETYANLCNVADTIFGKSDGTLSSEVGAFGVEHRFTLVYKHIVKKPDPKDVLTSTAALWGYFFNVGTVEVQETGKKSVAITLSGFPTMEKIICQGILGGTQRALELMGAKGVSVDLGKCMKKGHDCCQINCNWK